MMDILPPVGWGDLATKGDIAEVRGELKLLEGKMEHGFGRMQKSIYVSMLVSNVTVVSLVLAVLRVA